jgi:hypothetical protein
MVAAPAVSPGDVAVTVMVPAPVARTIAKARLSEALRVLSRNVSWVMLPLSTATMVPGPVIEKVTEKPHRG